MATRNATAVRRSASSGAKDMIVKWTGLLNGDDGSWFAEPGMVLRSYSVSGVFGAGGTVALKCSGADALAAAVTGAQADESVITGAGTITVAGTTTNGQYLAAPCYRPTVTGGDGTTNLTVTMYFIQD